jgi:hypothetical protein
LFLQSLAVNELHPHYTSSEKAKITRGIEWTLEGAIKKFWISKHLNLYTINRAWEMHKQIDLGKIDLHVYFTLMLYEYYQSLLETPNFINFPTHKVTR